MARSGAEILESILGHWREPAEIRRPAMVPIDVDSWSRPDNALRTLCITQADWAIRWHLANCHGVFMPEYERRGLQQVDGERYDVYEAAIPGGRREYWMNVSYWFGRGLLIGANRFDAPSPNEEATLGECFGPEQTQNLPFQPEALPQVIELLNHTALRFCGYSSQQFYNNVSGMRMEPGRVVIEATAVRRFIADSLPLFHGFLFLKPFLVHQAMHVIVRTDPRLTEVSPIADYAVPVPGEHCVQFTPYPQETPAHDFWHYMLWSHRPGAFETEAEQKSLTFSAATAFLSGFLKPHELVAALDDLDVRGADGEVLKDLAEQWRRDCDAENERESQVVASVVSEPAPESQTALPLVNGGERVTGHGLAAIPLPEGNLWYRSEQCSATERQVVFFSLNAEMAADGCYLIIEDATDNPEEPVVLASTGVSDSELDAQLRKMADTSLSAAGAELVKWRGSGGFDNRGHLRLFSSYITRRDGVETVGYSVRFDVRGRKVVLIAGVPVNADAERGSALRDAISAFDIIE